MKTKAIQFAGSCSLGRCDSHNDTEVRPGVEVLIEAFGTLAGGEDMGEMICDECALWLSRMLKKRAKQAREKTARGLRYKYNKKTGEPRWVKPKAAPAEQPTEGLGPEPGILAPAASEVR